MHRHISFTRTLIRKMAQQEWKVTKHRWQLDAQGFGHVIYKLTAAEPCLSFSCFCDEIADDERNDRVVLKSGT